MYLIFLLPLISFAANTRDTYRTCFNASNKLESPADRDAEKIHCFNSLPRRPMNLCLNLAGVLEHTSTSDALILDCISTNILKMKIETFLETTKSLHYAESKDKAIWTYLEHHAVQSSQCKRITDKMVYPHNRNVALNYCLLRN
ncbi:MAG: hypothetical protein JNL11_14015 [Bdellovibrionaceae bacterium]|nr:hypothetical protein [Pseudobdellovibrionaceae bacterium]